MKIFQEGANAEKTSVVQHLTGPSNKAFFSANSKQCDQIGRFIGPWASF